LLTAAQEQRAGPCDDGAVLPHRGVDEADAPALALDGGVHPYRFGQRDGAQQVDGQSRRLQIRIATRKLDGPAQKAADIGAADRRAPWSTGERAGYECVTVDAEERLAVVRHRQ
jgi:hypothetical protein